MNEFASQVMQSFGRCCSSEDSFFQSFYDYFFNASPAIRSHFQNFDLQDEKKVIRNAVLNIILYARGMSSEPLQAIAKRNAKSNLDIPPAAYPIWIDCWIQAIKQYDAEFNSDLEVAWRKVLENGVKVIADGYEKY